MSSSTSTQLDTLRVGAASELGIESDDVAAFYAAEWPRRIALSIADFYRWQFVYPPANRGRDMNCVAVDSENRILGVMGLNQRPFVLDGRVRPGAELTTWIVSPAARGRGAGVSIMRYLQNRYEVLLGMGISTDALPIYLKSGFQYLRGIPRFVRIYNADAVKAHLQIEKLGMQLVERALQQQHVAYEVGIADEGAISRISAAFFAEYNGFLRDWDHVRWRLIDHPSFAYSVAIVTRGNHECVVAYRTDEVEGARLMHVVDCFGDRDALPAACAFVDDEARRLGIHAADWYVTSPRISSVLRPLGWFSTLDDYFIQLTHLFHPPELRVPPTTSMVYYARDAMTQIGDLSRLYVTKADLDLDRSTVESLERGGIGRVLPPTESRPIHTEG